MVQRLGSRGRINLPRSLLTLLISYSSLTDGVWEGRLVHLSGIDVIGPTAGSLSRLLQDREAELWEGKRIVQQADKDEVGVIMRYQSQF